MSGPGARVQGLGTIFTRVQGLLRAGALKETEKPLWYDVYQAFPPKTFPKLSQEQIVPPRKILYLDDIVRAQFYRTFGNPEPIDLRHGDGSHVSQRFIEKYWVLQKQNPNKKMIEVFTATTDALKMEGEPLKTIEELRLEQEEQRLTAIAEQQAGTDATVTSHSTAAATVGQTPHQTAEAEDTIEPVKDQTLPS